MAALEWGQIAFFDSKSAAFRHSDTVNGGMPFKVGLQSVNKEEKKKNERVCQQFREER